MVDAAGAVVAEVPVRAGASLLHAFVGRVGSPIQVGCRGGGCGVCRVQVLAGPYEGRRMSRRFVSEADQQAGLALACRTTAMGDLTVRWSPVLDR